MSASVKIVAILVARAGKAEELRALLDHMLTQTRAEPENLQYDLWRDQANPDRFVLDELYASNAGVAAHRQTPHFQAYLAKINDLAERSAFVLDPAKVG